MNFILSIDDSYEVEQDIKKSRFITRIIPVHTEDDALKNLQQICEIEARATHNCFAYILGDQQNIQRASDNGEPSGTAGAPILEVLKREHLTNVLVVVTRYFGGIKLGAGGLIRAYGSSTSLAVQDSKKIQLVDQELLLIRIDYHNNNQLNYYLEQKKLTQVQVEYTTQVAIEISVPKQNLRVTIEELTRLFNGNISFKKLGQHRVTLPYP